jgi:hypothetical protein
MAKPLPIYPPNLEMFASADLKEASQLLRSAALDEPPSNVRSIVLLMARHLHEQWAARERVLERR